MNDIARGNNLTEATLSPVVYRLIKFYHIKKDYKKY